MKEHTIFFLGNERKITIEISSRNAFKQSNTNIPSDTEGQGGKTPTSNYEYYRTP